MGHHERKEVQKKIRQEDIINAAERVFFSKGYEAATMDDICKEAEYSKRTLYIYFSSKEQLYFAIIVRAFITLNGMYQACLQESRHSTGLERLLAMGQTFVDFIQMYPNYFRAIVYYQASGDEPVSNDPWKQTCFIEGEKTYHLLSETLLQGVKDHSLRPDIDITNTAFILYANVIGISNLILHKEKYIHQTHNRSVSELVEEMYRFVTRAIANPERVAANCQGGVME